jgi:hypothetical protein
MLEQKGMCMWKDFTDFEIAELAGRYGFADNLVFAYDMSLANRQEIEDILTEYEFSQAFESLDFKPEVV